MITFVTIISYTTRIFIVLCITLNWVSFTSAQVTDEQIQKIRDALPDEPVIAPDQPRKVLIFSLCKGFRHSCIPVGNEALVLLGENTGAYEAVVSEDSSVFQRESLEIFDAIIINNATGTLFEDRKLKDNLLQFVRSGKGIVGIHAATDCFYDWSEYGFMMGAYFDGHPWHEKVTIKLDEPLHPINAMFGGSPLIITDEIYQFQQEPYSRDLLRVLLSLDTQHTDMKKTGIKRTDDDFAVSWIRSFGKGRVFYCSLGHREEIFWNPTILQHYLAGIQYATGDLPADSTPSSESSTVIQQAVSAASSYQYGDSRLPLTIIADHVRNALKDDTQTDQAELMVLDLLRDSDSTTACREFACRQLSLIGSNASVSTLAELLRNNELAHMARYALQRIPGDKVDDALVEALNRLEGELLIGVINTIGERGQAESVLSMRQFMSANNGEEVSLDAVNAIGKIGGPSAEKILRTELDQCGNTDDVSRIDALACSLLRIADQYVQEDDYTSAAEIYTDLYDSKYALHIRQSALRGIVQSDPQAAFPLLIQRLDDPDSVWRGMTASFLVDLPGEHVTRKLCTYMSSVTSSEHTLMIIDILKRRGDRAAENSMLQLMDNSDLDIRLAATLALIQLGGNDCIVPLAQRAAQGDSTAQNVLCEMTYPELDQSISNLLTHSSPEIRSELAQTLGARQAVQHRKILNEMAHHDPATSVRVAAFHSLAILSDRDNAEHKLTLLLQALKIADQTDQQRMILQSMRSVRHTDVLLLMKPYHSVIELKDTAVNTTINVARLIGDEHRDESINAIQHVLSNLDENEALYEKALDALDHIQRHEGFITQWMYAGPYVKDGYKGNELLDIAFPPEIDTENTWQILPEDALVDNRICDLRIMTPGSHCCGYLKTVLVSDQARSIRMEIGSDDGVKVWLNGEIVHANDVERGLTIGQDVITVTLKEGHNHLMLKITQGGGDWQACCRIRDSNGLTLSGVEDKLPE